ncbi:MAG TPA: (Fe-S)-binding protein [Verrucomicrobia bacterium]|nr:(Fe-S)-binding protein [Verrucomicrobiota bacterium]
MPLSITPAASHLKGLDYSVVQQCMHCGLCLPTCPTYDDTKLERNSPRGRISLMRAIADGKLDPGKVFAEEMSFCLGCLACMTSCPAGVNYAELFEHARAEVEESGVMKSPFRKLIRFVTMGWLFQDLRRMQWLGRLIRFYRNSGLLSLVQQSGILKMLPQRLQYLEKLTPVIQPAFSNELIEPVSPAVGEKRYRVAMLTGCAQDIIFSDVNRDTVEVLQEYGCEVITPASQFCCGSLHGHNGEWEQAKDLARKQIDLFPPAAFDAIISNAAGCGSHLKHYSSLLSDDPEYLERAREWDRKLKDIHEWLVEIGPLEIDGEAAAEMTVGYHEACHLCHGQKITSQPRTLLKSVPNLKLVEIPESNWCCGSAGVYNVTQPEMATKLLKRKIGHIRETGADILATGNPGCMLHIQNGLNQAEMPIKVVHPISLLAQAFRERNSSKNDK